MGTTADGGKGSKGRAAKWRSANRRRQLQMRSSHHGVMPTPPPPPVPNNPIRRPCAAPPPPPLPHTAVQGTRVARERMMVPRGYEDEPLEALQDVVVEGTVVGTAFVYADLLYVQLKSASKEEQRLMRSPSGRANKFRANRNEALGGRWRDIQAILQHVVYASAGPPLELQKELQVKGRGGRVAGHSVASAPPPPPHVRIPPPMTSAGGGGVLCA